MSTLKAGFSRICVTPPLGIDIVGLYEHRYCTGVLDDLYVDALAFDNGIQKVVFISIDALYLYKNEIDRYVGMIAQYCDLPKEAIFLATTHTHCGPAIGESIQLGYKGFDDYDDRVGQALRDSAKYALEDLKDAKVYTAVNQAKDLAFIRRYYMKDGTVCTNPTIGDPNIAGPVTQPCEDVNLVKIEREGADDIYFVNFGVHPCSITGTEITADFPHFVRSTLEKALDNVKCIFFTGFQGDVGCTDRRPLKGDWDLRNGYKRTEHIGRSIAGAVLQMCTLMKPMTDTTIAFGQKTVTIPSNQENDRLEEARRINDLAKAGRSDEIIVPGAEMNKTVVLAEAARIVDLEFGPESFDYTVSAVRIGDIVFGGLPGEPFTELGNRIREASPFDLTVLCCLVNGGGTYFPASSAYEQGGYEVATSYLRKGGDDILVGGLSNLIAELK